MLQIIMVTCRRRRRGHSHLHGRGGNNKACIFVSWHENAAYILYCMRRRGISMLASSSRDGELIARAVIASGNDTVRGSTSSKGSRAARTLIRVVRSGRSALITPDGPRGPQYKLQAGALRIAALAGCPLVPYHIESNRQWRVSSWDKLKIPKFFARVYEHYGEPYYVDRDLLARDEEKIRKEFEALMMENMKTCMAAAGNSE